jgi:RNA polymerase sigma-70 factor (ECF subfamily)
MQDFDLYAANDTVLLLEIGKGSRSAFNVLYDRYWKKVYNIAYKRINDREIAEDVTQDIFVQLWTRNSDSIILDLPSYLNTAARNGIFKRMGKEGKYTELPDDVHEIENQLNGADSKLLHKEFMDAFMELVEALPDQQRTIFKLRFNDNLSSQQIADQLQISPKTVRNHIGRALTTLKSELIVLQLLMLFYHK